jgi:hypothetical protein
MTIATTAENPAIEFSPLASLDSTPVGYEAAMPFLAVEPWNAKVESLKSWLAADAA